MIACIAGDCSSIVCASSIIFLFFMIAIAPAVRNSTYSIITP